MAAIKQNRSERRPPKLSKDVTLTLLDRSAALSGHIGRLANFATPEAHRYAFDQAISEARSIIVALTLAQEKSND